MLEDKSKSRRFSEEEHNYENEEKSALGIFFVNTVKIVDKFAMNDGERWRIYQLLTSYQTVSSIFISS